MQLKTAATIFLLVIIGTVSIAWSHRQGPRQFVPAVKTISPETLRSAMGQFRKRNSATCRSYLSATITDTLLFGPVLVRPHCGV